MPIATQNWDGVTAPAIPAGWNVDSNYTTTASPGGGIVPVSSPNVLALAATSGAVDRYATYATTDGVGGNVVVAAYFNVTNIATHEVAGVTARGSASTLNSSGTSQYRGFLDYQAGEVNIDKFVGGSQTNLANLTASIISAATWYLVELTCLGSVLTLAIQRQSDGDWMNSAGNWVGSPANALTVSDSSITGSGYSGIHAQQGTSGGGGDWYSDNWSLSLASAPVVVYPWRVASRPLLPIHVSGMLRLDGSQDL